LIIVDVSASTEAFVGAVCLIAVHIYDAHVYDNLFAPELSGERRLDRPFRRRLQSKPKCQQ